MNTFQHDNHTETRMNFAAGVVRPVNNQEWFTQATGNRAEDHGTEPLETLV